MVKIPLKSILKIGGVFLICCVSTQVVFPMASAVDPGDELPAKSLLIILDASGSMFQKIEGGAKIDVARRVIRNLIKKWPHKVRIGLMVYGHRSKNDCKDIELLVPLDEPNVEAVKERLAEVVPQGMTPIANALKTACKHLENVPGNKSIVLISDGNETCGMDPCKTIQQIRAKGFPVRVHVVGFDVQKKEKNQLDCIARAGRGKYFSVENAAQLDQALWDVQRTVDPKLAGKILCSAGRNGTTKNRRIILINLDGGGISLLTDSTQHNDTFPRYSRAANKIVFVSDRKGHGTRNLYIMDLNGHEMKRLTEYGVNEFADSPDWSPDGGRIAYTLYRKGKYTLRVMNLKNYKDEEIAPDHSAFPAWSYDGGSIAFLADGAICIANPDGSSKSTLCSSVYGSFLNWHYDRETFVSTNSDGLFLINSKCQRKIIFPKSKWSFESVEFSKDGNFIVVSGFESWVGLMLRDRKCRTIILNMHGKLLKNLTGENDNYTHASWFE